MKTLFIVCGCLFDEVMKNGNEINISKKTVNHKNTRIDFNPCVCVLLDLREKTGDFCSTYTNTSYLYD